MKKELAKANETLAERKVELEQSRARAALAEVQAKASATKLMARARHVPCAGAKARADLDQDAALEEVRAHLRKVQEAYRRRTRIFACCTSRWRR